MNSIYGIIQKSKNLGQDHAKILIQWTVAKNRVNAIKDLVKSLL
jgi:hypothetical protein